MSENHVYVPVRSHGEHARFWGVIVGIFALVAVGWVFTIRSVVMNAVASGGEGVQSAKSFLESLDEKTQTERDLLKLEAASMPASEETARQEAVFRDVATKMKTNLETP